MVPAKKKRDHVWSTSMILMLIVIGVLGLVTGAKTRFGQNQPTAPRAKVQKPSLPKVTDTLPPVVSKVADITVLSAKIENQGKEDAGVAIELRNETKKAVTAVTLTFGEVSITKDGGIYSDVPATMIEPQGTLTIRFAVSNLEKDVPVYVAAVIYADNSETGQDVVLELIHQRRDTERLKRDAKKKVIQ
jgi:hypothetical protein